MRDYILYTFRKVKTRRMRWVRYVACLRKKRNAHAILVGKKTETTRNSTYVSNMIILKIGLR